MFSVTNLIHRQDSNRARLLVLALAGLLGFSGCQSPGTPLPPTLKPSLAWPECPKIGGIYELQGEPLRNISDIAQELTLEGDGSLLVKTRIMNQSKSAFFSTPVPHEEYSARFRRLD